jgi:uncharacterized protein YggE
MRITALLCLSACALLAQEQPRRSTVRATGEATVIVKPDVAHVDVGVVSEGATAQAAGAQNAKQLAGVLEELRKAAGPQAEIETLNFWVNPKYRHGEARTPVISGYTASNTLRVKIRDLSKVSAVIDTATKSGANNIQGVNFTLLDENAARAQALKPAALTARSNAEAIAASLGMKVVRVISAEEGQAGPIVPMREMAMAAQANMRESVATPIEPRNIEVRATVTVTLEVAP